MSPAANPQGSLRPATQDDVDSIVALVNRAFVVERFFKDGDRTNPKQIREMMDEGTFLLLSSDERLLACIYVKLNGERAYLGVLAVDPAKQRAGLGRRMMHEGENYAQACGCRFADIRIVNLRTKNLLLARGLGYVESGRESADVIPNLKQPVHFVRMSKML